MQDLKLSVKKIKDRLTGSGITLTKNEIEYIIKVNWFLENRQILLKGTTKGISSQEGGFPNFLGQLMTPGLPLIKNVFTPLAKRILMPLRITAVAPATDSYSKEHLWT